MRKTVAKERLQDYIGESLGHSEWMRIDQARVNAFADATEDHQFIHVDPERAAKSPFGATVAHGFLSLSLLPHLTAELGVVPEGMAMLINYGLDKVRFPQPLRVGSEIRATATLLEVSEKNPGQFLMKTAISLEIRGEKKPALFAEWLSMVVTQ